MRSAITWRRWGGGWRRRKLHKQLRISDCGFRIDNRRPKGTESMNPEEMKARTMKFSLRVVKMVDSLPRGKASDVMGRQLLRSGTSVAANYRAACRSRSSADFINKMSIVEEDADESIFWMELLGESGLINELRTKELMKEANELLAITVSSINTARKRTKA
jgi:four helix bundle protein